MASWQDINTAPRDGRTVLVWNDFCGAYLSRFKEGEWPLAETHHSRITGFHAALYFPVPSYWMPLPADPARPNTQTEQERP